MADQYGAIQLPLELPKPDGAISDPLLDYSLSFFKAVLNSKGATAWASVAPGRASPPVKTILTDDPADLNFNESDLPCLYMWRPKGDAPERLAEDIYCTRDDIMVLWVFPPASQATQRVRSSFVAFVTKALHIAIELARDPCWVLDEDPDPSAIMYGSVFPRFAGWAEMYMDKWTTNDLIVAIDKSESRSYPAWQTTLKVTEVFDRDLTKFAPNALTATVSNAAGVVIGSRNIP